MPTDHGQNNETVIFPLPGLIITQPPVRWPRWTFCEPSSNCRSRRSWHVQHHRIIPSKQSIFLMEQVEGESLPSLWLSHDRRGERHHDPDHRYVSLTSVFLFLRTEACIIRRTWAESFKYTNRRRFLYQPCVCPAVLVWPTEHKHNPN